MIQITAHMRILVAVKPADFRKGIDGLCALCRRELGSDPFGGAVFVFCNRRRTCLRILVYDGQGFWLCHKRLSSGKFRWAFAPSDSKVKSLAALELQTLLWNGDLRRIEAPPPWRPLPLP
ncbi:IS66 family insertion sequence element accessory protein TnpB [Desulforhabdus sp. TSK]|uniref:IS66 family insertion sequence element accessory protein TnpB n=1 Tax=Desulforhabdus sp. TSK TaxID=2925014 RepID=UPI001FC80F7B|nr:IS66 family insertion sequence element accessory protein TnpB [Desulforhabdus sp. TSK]GKT10978.1 transposase [Desulforhabdus sp. TSK]